MAAADTVPPSIGSPVLVTVDDLTPSAAFRIYMELVRAADEAAGRRIAVTTFLNFAKKEVKNARRQKALATKPEDVLHWEEREARAAQEVITRTYEVTQATKETADAEAAVKAYYSSLGVDNQHAIGNKLEAFKIAKNAKAYHECVACDKKWNAENPHAPQRPIPENPMFGKTC
jgi:hypothetical protein